MALTLQIGNGDEKKLRKDLKIASGTTTHVSLQLDTMTLTTREKINAAPLIAPFDKVILRDGARIVYVGWNDIPRRRAVGAKSEWIYTLVGPWKWLRETPYKAPRWGYDGLHDSGIVTLGAKTRTEGGRGLTERITLVDQLEAIVMCASNAGAPISADINIGDLHIPYERRVNDTCESALLALLQWMPGVVGHWDLSAENCQLVLRESGASKTCDEQLALTAADLRPRYDQLYTEVEVLYHYPDPTLSELDESLKPFVPERFYPVTATAGPGSDAAQLNASRKLSRTIELQPGESYQALTDEEGVTIPQKVIAFASRLQTDAEFTKTANSSTSKTTGIDWDNVTGDRWHWGGVLDDGTGHYSVAQQITRDLFKGTETITVGTARQLGIEGLASLWKKRGDGGDSSAPADKDGGKRGQAATSGPFGALKVTLAPTPVKDNGARWKIDGRPPQESGDTLSAIHVGEVTITFTDVPGWIKPPDITKTIANGGTVDVPASEATYQPAPCGPFEPMGYSKTQLRIGRSTINGAPPEGFNPDDNTHPYLVTEANGLFWTKTVIDTFGDPTVTVGHGTVLPTSSDPDHERYDLVCSWTKLPPDDNGVVRWSVHSDAYGPINVITCIQWGVSPITYNIVWMGGGHA